MTEKNIDRTGTVLSTSTTSINAADLTAALPKGETVLRAIAAHCEHHETLHGLPLFLTGLRAALAEDVATLTSASLVPSVEEAKARLIHEIRMCLATVRCDSSTPVGDCQSFVDALILSVQSQSAQPSSCEPVKSVLSIPDPYASGRFEVIDLGIPQPLLTELMQLASAKAISIYYLAAIYKEGQSQSAQRLAAHFHDESCYAMGPGDTEVLICKKPHDPASTVADRLHDQEATIIELRQRLAAAEQERDARKATEARIHQILDDHRVLREVTTNGVAETLSLADRVGVICHAEAMGAALRDRAEVALREIADDVPEVRSLEHARVIARRGLGEE